MPQCSSYPHPAAQSQASKANLNTRRLDRLDRLHAQRERARVMITVARPSFMSYPFVTTLPFPGMQPSTVQTNTLTSRPGASCRPSRRRCTVAWPGTGRAGQVYCISAVPRPRRTCGRNFLYSNLWHGSGVVLPEHRQNIDVHVLPGIRNPGALQ